jgi:hypothetical protein
MPIQPNTFPLSKNKRRTRTKIVKNRGFPSTAGSVNIKKKNAE